MAGVALGDIYLFYLAGVALIGSGLALVARLGCDWSPVTPHPPSFCVAGVALMALGWLCRHAWAGIGRR